MKILLTGASGFIGSKLLVRFLAAQKVQEVICLCHRDAPDFVEDPRLRYVHGDVTDPSWHHRVPHVDVVVHVAANASFESGNNHDSVNYEGTLRMIECATNAHATHFVLLSSIGAVDRAADDRVDRALHSGSIPSPKSDYGRSKLRAEAAVRQSGIPWTILRPAWVYGRDMRLTSHLCVLASMVKTRHVSCCFDWPGKVSVIHVDDLCDVVEQLATNTEGRDEVLFAATEAMSIGQIFQLFGSALGKSWAGKIPLPSWLGARLVSRWHRFLPLSIANLFVDYLTCDTEPFLTRLGPKEPQRLNERFEDILSNIDPLRQTWLVTGAGSGIGHSLCRMLRDRGTQVVGVDRVFPEPMLPGVQYETLDLMTPNAVGVLRKLVAAHTVAVVVHNAGVGTRGRFASLSLPQLQAMLAVNVSFPLLFTHSIVGAITRRHGTIVTVTSSMAGTPLPEMGVYTASKGFMQTWSIALAEELGDACHVLTVAPTGTKTRFQDNAGVRGGQKSLLAPDEVAAAIIEGVVARRHYRFVGSLLNNLILFLIGLLPLTIQSRVWGKLFERFR